MNSLLKLMPTMMRLSGDNEAVREQAAFAAWRFVTGQQIAHSCIPLKLEQKHLIVAVLDEAWKKQMERVSGDFLFRLNSVVGAPIVTLIEFRIDYEFVKATQAATPKPPVFEHTQELTDELSPAAAHIKDEALRAQFLRAAAKYLERKGETVNEEQ
jgi:hypothetical protein